MKNLKTFLGAFVVVLMSGGLAFAGWNIQQGGRGQTVFENEDGIRAPAGDNGITVSFTSLSQAWTRFVTAHRGGVVARMYVVADSGVSGTGSVFTLAQQWSEALGQTWTPVLGLSVSVTGTMLPGAVTSDEPATTDLSDLSLYITAGETLAIRNDGGSNVNTETTVTIIIE